ncbi:transketolase [Xylophilus sp. GOD-11R]|uniref:transketolase n=1 Tax=Xylophilus sp. GOD-11R TaxID=3089814 RepID=UPI00298C5CE6|nr:transketolase [Xylophilus sp. GOD-11R]WPB58074.1 transketolase [Xylophilus sp. GOD-11R]
MQDTLQDRSTQSSAARFDAAQLRKTVLDMAFAGNTVHIGCAFSLIEILAVLYRQHLRYPGNDPKAAQRDYLVLSKGHGVMAQYACMYELGWLQRQDIERYFADGSDLKGLSDSRIPGLEVTSGSLGHGFSVGVGMALGARMRKTDQKTYIVVGDGEINEGPIWEGALFAAHHQLDNLVVIVDENGFQAMGRTEDVLHLGDIAAKFEAFGFEAVKVDGHDEAALDAAITALWASTTGKPKAIVAKTTKGRGVDFMEHDNIWHYTRLNDKTYAEAVAALGIEKKNLQGEDL